MKHYVSIPIGDHQFPTRYSYIIDISMNVELFIIISKGKNLTSYTRMTNPYI